MNRRRLLGGLGFGVLGGLLLPIRARSSGTGRGLVVYWVKGGWDPSYVFDPHFGSATVEGDSAAEAGTAGGISFADAAERPAVRAFFESWGSRSVVVNGVSVGSISHTACTQLMLTGSRSDAAADISSLVAVGAGGELLLPNFVLSGPRFPGPYGATTIPLSTTLFGTAAGTVPASAPYDADAEAAVRAWLAEEAGRMSFPGAEDIGREYADGLLRRAQLESVASSFPTETTSEADLVAVAVQALSLGLSRCVAMEGSVPNPYRWDSHEDNHTNQQECFEHLFTQLAALMEALSAADLVETTTVMVLSEMGRTPVENANGGKDHWPTTSALLVGAGLSGGRVLGVTDDTLVGQTVDPDTGEASDSGERVTCANLLAGVLQSFDVDPAEAWPDATPFEAPWG